MLLCCKICAHGMLLLALNGGDGAASPWIMSYVDGDRAWPGDILPCAWSAAAVMLVVSECY